MLAWVSPISFEQPAWLWLLALEPVLVLVSLRTLRGLERRRRVTAIVLRGVVIALFAMVLARVNLVRTTHRLAVFFLTDRSRSIPPELRERSEDYVRTSARLARTDDVVGIVGFDGEATLDLPPSRAGGTDFMFGTAIEPDRTDVARALRTALASFPEGYGKRIVIATDMNQNAGDVLSEVRAAAANGAVVDVLPLRYEHANEILFDRIAVPTHAARDTRIPVRMILRSQKPTRARVHLFQNDREIATRDVDLKGGMRPEAVTELALVGESGTSRFEARVEPLDARADAIAENNVATGFSIVQGEQKLLVLTTPDGREDHAALVAALQRAGLQVEVSQPGVRPLDLQDLQAYGAVMLANISADEFTGDQKESLASYVRDTGGGLILTGGDRSFGAGGWIGSPIEAISPVDFEVKHRRVIPRGALALIMHSCEIDRGNYWGEQVAIASVKAISSKDYIGVLAYTWTPGGTNWEVPMGVASDKDRIIAKIKKIQIGDMPDFGPGMEMAVDALLACKDAAQRHMIIISDGDPTPPSDATLSRMARNKITCSTVGIGYGSHVFEQPLQRIANATSGRFYRCTNPKQLPQIFIKEAKVVRRSLINEDPFRPRLVYGLAQTTRGFADGDFPELGGLVLTSPKRAAIEMPLVRATTEGNDPVMAQWQYELGKVLVFTSGQWAKWGPSWVSWDRFGAFWAQAVRWAMRQPESADFDVVTRLEGDVGHVVVEALKREDASFLNQMQIAGRLVGPDLKPEPIRLTQTGPGRYEATFNVRDKGQYLAALQYAAPGGETGRILTGLTMAYSPEYRDMGANLTLMEEVRTHGNGRVLTFDPKVDRVYEFKRPTTVARQPIWRWVALWLLLPLFLLDVASRRLASRVAMSFYVEAAVLGVMLAILVSWRASWWGYVGAVVLAEVVGWSLRREAILPFIRFFTHTVWVLRRREQTSAESLAQLRTARDRVREGMTSDAAGAAEAAAQRETRAASTAPAPDRRARFDVGDAAAQKAAGDLTTTLGGATPSGPDAGKPGAKPGGEAQTTDRLLRAKRRAQQDIDAKTRKPEE